MGQSHENMSHDQNQFMDELKRRAEKGRQSGNASITAGSEGEPVLASWRGKNGVEVVHRPKDPQGILRISVGGGRDTPVKLDYCTIRGGVGACIELLEKAIEALKESPE